MRHQLNSRHAGEFCPPEFSRSSHLAATRFHGSIVGGFGGDSASTDQNTNDSGTASGGSLVSQGIKDKVITYFGNYTNIDDRKKKKNSDNNSIGNVTVEKGGTVTYQTNGLDAGTLAAFGNSIAGKISSSGGGGGPVVYNSPAPSATSAQGAVSNIRWGIIAAVAVALAAFYFLFNRKKA